MLFPAMPVPPPPSGPALPAAVPGYDQDLDAAHRALGQAYLYIGQLSAVLTERAVEANRLHDELAAAKARVRAVEVECAALASAVEVATAQLTERAGGALLDDEAVA